MRKRLLPIVPERSPMPELETPRLPDRPAPLPAPERESAPRVRPYQEPPRPVAIPTLPTLPPASPVVMGSTEEPAVTRPTAEPVVMRSAGGFASAIQPSPKERWLSDYWSLDSTYRIKKPTVQDFKETVIDPVIAYAVDAWDDTRFDQFEAGFLGAGEDGDEFSSFKDETPIPIEFSDRSRYRNPNTIKTAQSSLRYMASNQLMLLEQPSDKAQVELESVDPGGYDLLRKQLASITDPSDDPKIDAAQVQQAIAQLYDLATAHLNHFLQTFSPNDPNTHTSEAARHLKRSLALISLVPPLTSILEIHNQAASDVYKRNLIQFVLGDATSIDPDDPSSYKLLVDRVDQSIESQPPRALTIVSAGPGSGKTQSIVDVLGPLINQLQAKDAAQNGFSLDRGRKFRFALAGFNRTTVNEIIAKLSKKTGIPPSRESFEQKVGVSPSTIDSLADRVARGPGLVYINQRGSRYEFNRFSLEPVVVKKIETVEDLWSSESVNPFRVDVSKALERFLNAEGNLSQEANQIAMIHRTTSISPFPHFPYRARRFDLETLDEVRFTGQRAEEIVSGLIQRAQQSGDNANPSDPLAELVRLLIVHDTEKDGHGRVYRFENDYALLQAVIRWLEQNKWIPSSVSSTPAVQYQRQLIARLVIRHLQRFIEYLEVAWGLPLDAIESVYYQKLERDAKESGRSLNESEKRKAFTALLAALLSQSAGYWSGEYERRAEQAMRLRSNRPLMTWGDFEDYLANDPIHRIMLRATSDRIGHTIERSIQNAIEFYQLIALGMSAKAAEKHDLLRESFRGMGYTVNHLAHSAIIALRTNLLIPGVDPYEKRGGVVSFTDGVSDRPGGFLLMDEVQDASAPVFDLHGRGAYTTKEPNGYRYYLIAIGDQRQQVNRFAGATHLMFLLSHEGYRRLMNRVMHPTDPEGQHVVVHKLDASFRNYGDRFTERISQAVRRIAQSWARIDPDRYERALQEVRTRSGNPNIPSLRFERLPHPVKISPVALEREVKGTVEDPDPNNAKEKVYQFTLEGRGQIQLSVTTANPIVVTNPHKPGQQAPSGIEVTVSMEVTIGDQPIRLGKEALTVDQLVDQIETNPVRSDSIALVIEVRNTQTDERRSVRVEGLSPDDFKNRAGRIVEAMGLLRTALEKGSGNAIVRIQIEPYPRLVVPVESGRSSGSVVLLPVQYQNDRRVVGYVVQSWPGLTREDSPPQLFFTQLGALPSKELRDQLGAMGYTLESIRTAVLPATLGEMVTPLYQLFAEELGKIVLYQTGRSLAEVSQPQTRTVRIQISGHTALLTNNPDRPIRWVPVFTDSVNHAAQRLADHFSRAVRYVSASATSDLSGMKRVDLPLDELVRIAEELALYHELQSYYDSNKRPADETLVIITPTNAEETVIPLLLGALGVDRPFTTANIHGGVKGATYSRAVWIPPVVQTEGNALSYVANTRGKVRSIQANAEGKREVVVQAFKSFTIPPRFSQVRTGRNALTARQPRMDQVRGLVQAIESTIAELVGHSQESARAGGSMQSAVQRAARPAGIYQDPFHSPYFSSAYHHPAPDDPGGLYAFNAYTGDQNAAMEYMGALVERNLQGGLSTYAMVSSVLGGIVHRKANERRVPKGKRYHTPIQHTVMNLSNINRTSTIVSNRVPSTHGEALKELVTPDGRLVEELVLANLIVLPLNVSGAMNPVRFDASALFSTYQRIAGEGTALPYSTEGRVEPLSLEHGLVHRKAGVIELVWSEGETTRRWHAVSNPLHPLAALELMELSGAENLSGPIAYESVKRQLQEEAAKGEAFHERYPALADLLEFIGSLKPEGADPFDLLIQSVWIGHLCTPPAKTLRVVSKERSTEEENAVTELEPFEEGDAQELLERALQESDEGTVWATKALVREFIALREAVALAGQARGVAREDLEALAYQRFEKAFDQFMGAAATHLSSKRAIAQAAKSNPMSYVMAHIATMGGATNPLVSLSDGEREWAAPTVDAPIGAVLSDPAMRARIKRGLIDQLSPEERNFLSARYPNKPNEEAQLEALFSEVESLLGVSWKTRAMGLIDPLLYALGKLWSSAPQAYHKNQEAIDAIVTDWTRESLVQNRYALSALIDQLKDLLGLDKETVDVLKRELLPIEFFLNLLGSRVFEGYVARYPLLFNTSALIVPIRLIPMPQLHIPDAYLWAMNGDADGDRAAFMVIGVFKRTETGALSARQALAPSLRRLAFMSVINPIETQDTAVYNLTPLAEGNGADPQITAVAFGLLGDYDTLRTAEAPPSGEDGFYALEATLDLNAGTVVWHDRPGESYALWAVDESGRLLVERNRSLRAFLIDESYDDLDTGDPQLGVLVKARLARPGRLWSRYRAKTEVRWADETLELPFQAAWFLAGWIRALAPMGESAQRRFLDAWKAHVKGDLTMDAFRQTLSQFIGSYQNADRLKVMGLLHRFWLLVERAENLPVAPIHFAGYDPQKGQLDDFDPETITKKGELVYPEPVRAAIERKRAELERDLTKEEALALMSWELMRLVQNEEWYHHTNGYHQTILRVVGGGGLPEWRAYRIVKQLGASGADSHYKIEVYAIHLKTEDGTTEPVRDETLASVVQVERDVGFDPTGLESNWQITLRKPVVYQLVGEPIPVTPERIRKIMEEAGFLEPKPHSGLQLVAPTIKQKLEEATDTSALLALAKRSGFSQVTRIAMGLGLETLYERATFDPGVRAVVYKNPITSTSFNTKRIMALASNHTRFGPSARMLQAPSALMAIAPTAIGSDYAKQVRSGVAWLPRPAQVHVERNPITYATNRNIESGGIASKVASVSGLAHKVDPEIASALLSGATSGPNWRYVGASEPAVTRSFESAAAFLEWLRAERMVFNVQIENGALLGTITYSDAWRFLDQLPADGFTIRYTPEPVVAFDAPLLTGPLAQRAIISHSAYHFGSEEPFVPLIEGVQMTQLNSKSQEKIDAVKRPGSNLFVQPDLVDPSYPGEEEQIGFMTVPGYKVNPMVDAESHRIQQPLSLYTIDPPAEAGGKKGAPLFAVGGSYATELVLPHTPLVWVNPQWTHVSNRAALQALLRSIDPGGPRRARGVLRPRYQDRTVVALSTSTIFAIILDYLAQKTGRPITDEEEVDQLLRSIEGRKLYHSVELVGEDDQFSRDLIAFLWERIQPILDAAQAHGLASAERPLLFVITPDLSKQVDLQGASDRSWYSIAVRSFESLNDAQKPYEFRPIETVVDASVARAIYRAMDTVARYHEPYTYSDRRVLSASVKMVADLALCETGSAVTPFDKCGLPMSNIHSYKRWSSFELQSAAQGVGAHTWPEGLLRGYLANRIGFYPIQVGETVLPSLYERYEADLRLVRRGSLPMIEPRGATWLVVDQMLSGDGVHEWLGLHSPLFYRSLAAGLTGRPVERFYRHPLQKPAFKPQPIAMPSLKHTLVDGLVIAPSDRIKRLIAQRFKDRQVVFHPDFRSLLPNAYFVQRIGQTEQVYQSLGGSVRRIDLPADSFRLEPVGANLHFAWSRAFTLEIEDDPNYQATRSETLKSGESVDEFYKKIRPSLFKTGAEAESAKPIVFEIQLENFYSPTKAQQTAQALMERIADDLADPDRTDRWIVKRLVIKSKKPF